MEVRRYCDTLLEIVGYTSEDADSYIKKYFSNHEDPSLADKLIEQLDRTRESGRRDGDGAQLRGLTANPLNTALLCLVCEDTKGNLPSNRTKLYHELVSCALRRDFAKKNKTPPLDPVETCADQLNQLGKMALKALTDDRMYFSEDEMKCQSTDFRQLCFLSREASISKIRPVPCYAFTHKTFQEYFAAFYLAHELLITNDKGRDILLAKLSPVDKYWQRPETTNETKADADLHICKDTSFDWVKDTRLMSMEEKVVQNVFVKTLNLIAECEDGENELKDYQKKMFNCTLTHLNLDTVLIWDPGAIALAGALLSNCTLTHLSLPENWITDIGADAFGTGIQFNCGLKHLDLYQNWIGNRGVMALAKGLESNVTLTYLDLHQPIGCGDRTWPFLDSINYDVQIELIGELGASALARALRTNSTLTYLDLKENAIGSSGAVALGEALQSNHTLTHLYLSGNEIGDSGADALAKALQPRFNFTQ
ncbi:hypothetical protein OS493_005902 [Desmophyllum pertusum]|uniref:Uncharacterized protein n=1 Tax=Desmophyllum pertusum TaxID=174260 RepID=A0A9X0CIE1_9CNID|nr:hypothetical protein OS493_005902 [Desmophyllum pertusum]